MKNMPSQIIRSSVLGIAALLALVFTTGTLQYWQGWAYVVIAIVASGAYTLYLARHDPVLLKRCTEAGISYERPLYAFTNSNREHEQCWSKQYSGILSNFKEVYVSSTIGLRKPEAEAYDYVVRAIGASADRTVFFFDSLENIEGARARGLQAVHVKSSADLANALAVLIEQSRAGEEWPR